jgi:hypothetical protein
VAYAPITIPPGASFADMVALKGKPDIGDQINKQIIAPLANADKLSDMPDFNDATKFGTAKEMVDRLTNLVAIFENKALDFSKNRADGDDIRTYEHAPGGSRRPVLDTTLTRRPVACPAGPPTASEVRGLTGRRSRRLAKPGKARRA